MNPATLYLLRQHLERAQSETPEVSRSNEFNSHALPSPNMGAGDFIQIMVAAREIAQLPEKLQSGELTATEAGSLLDRRVGLLLSVAGLDSSDSDREKLYYLGRPNEFAIEGQEFKLHPFASYISEAVNMGLAPGQQPFTPESLAALQLDIIRGTIHESMSGENKKSLPMEIRSNMSTTGDVFGTGFNSLVLLKEEPPKELQININNYGSYESRANLYAPFDERIGLITGLDEHAYKQEVYKGYVARSREHLEEMDRVAASGNKNAPTLRTAYLHGEKAQIYFDEAVKFLKELEPDLDDKIYERRVVADLGVEQLPADYANKDVSSFKDAIIEDINDRTRDVAALFVGCSSAEDIRRTDRDVENRVDSIRKTIVELNNYGFIPHSAVLDSELLTQIRDRAKDLGAVADESGWILSLRAMDGNVAVCEPLEKPQVKAPRIGG